MAYVNLGRGGNRGGNQNRNGGGGGRSYNKQNYRPQFPPQQQQQQPQQRTMMSYGNVGQPGEPVSYVDNNAVGNSSSNNNAQFVRVALLYPYRNDQPDQFMDNPDPAWNTAEAASANQKQQQQENQIGSAGAAGQPCAPPISRVTLYNPTTAKFFGRMGENHCVVVYVEDSPRVANQEKQTTHPTVHVCIYENKAVQWIERTLTDPATGEAINRKSPIAPTLMPDTPVFARLFSPNNPQARSFATGNLSGMPGTRIAILPSKNVSMQYQLTLIQEA